MLPLGFACPLLGREGRDIDPDNRSGSPETPDKKQRDCSLLSQGVCKAEVMGVSNENKELWVDQKH